MSLRPALITAWCASVVAAFAGGCASDPATGWAVGTTHSTAYHSIAVPIFRNISYEKGLELDLARALVA